MASYEANELRYIPWEKCVSKEAELAGEKKKDVRFTVEESSGKLKIEQKQPDLVADTSTEILVQQALTRRALAMDQANLLEFNVMDQWTQRIMKARMQTPAENFSKPTWKQLEAADRQLFSELRDKTRSGVQTTGAGRPLDSLLPDAMYMNEVSCLLQPFPMPVSRDNQVKPEVPKTERPSPYGRGGGKGKGKHKTRFMTRLPQGLEGCRSHTNRGDPICFAFNLGVPRRARSATRASAFARCRNVGHMDMGPLRAQSGRMEARDYASKASMEGQAFQRRLPHRGVWVAHCRGMCRGWLVLQRVCIIRPSVQA